MYNDIMALSCDCIHKIGTNTSRIFCYVKNIVSVFITFFRWGQLVCTKLFKQCELLIRKPRWSNQLDKIVLVAVSLRVTQPLHSTVFSPFRLMCQLQEIKEA